MVPKPTWTAFTGPQQIAAGAPIDVARAVRTYAALHNADDPPIVFSDMSGRVMDLDLVATESGLIAQVEALTGISLAPRTADDAPRRGRPRLGVKSREITLLPRHWAWLDGRDGGASVTLRRLVDAAMRGEIVGERVRAAQEAAHRFLTVMAGNDPGYESALRMLYNGDEVRFTKWTKVLPGDIGAHARKLAAPAFPTYAD